MRRALLLAAGLVPVGVREGQPTKRVHVYGRKWSLLPASYKAVW